MHLAWSGNHDVVRRAAARRPGRARRRRAARPGRGACSAPGESYATPDVLAVWSDAGLDGAQRAAAPARAGPAAAPAPAAAGRPQHLGGRLLRPRPRPADRARRRAAEVGVERFVLDDGWFRAPPRRHGPGSATGTSTRTSGRTASARWSSHVRGLGMEFGLWVEPEMVNLDSDLARAHPDWVLRAGDGLPRAVAAPAGARPRATRRRTTTCSGSSTRC